MNSVICHCHKPFDSIQYCANFYLEVIHLIKHIKRLWGHYIALIVLSAILFFPIFWVYHFFRDSFGNEAALISLTITVITVLVFGIRGAVHTHRIIRTLRKEMPPPGRHGIIISLVYKVFKIANSRANDAANEIKTHPNETDPFPQQFITFPRKRRGKQPRFPEEKVRKAVLRWESRDPTFSVATLEEFLAQEFGNGPDGILLMPTSTFYDYRRRILEGIKSHAHE